jgi:hypothetical protein
VELAPLHPIVTQLAGTPWNAVILAASPKPTEFWYLSTYS